MQQTATQTKQLSPQLHQKLKTVIHDQDDLKKEWMKGVQHDSIKLIGHRSNFTSATFDFSSDIHAIYIETEERNTRARQHAKKRT